MLRSSAGAGLCWNIDMLIEFGQSLLAVPNVAACRRAGCLASRPMVYTTAMFWSARRRRDQILPLQFPYRL